MCNMNEDTTLYRTLNGLFENIVSKTATMLSRPQSALWWRHNDHAGVSNHQPHGCLLNRLFRRRSKKTSKLCVTGLCAGNSPGPVNFPHKGPVTRKMLPFDDVIMDNAVWSGKWKHIFIMTLKMKLTEKRIYCKTCSNSVQSDYTGAKHNYTSHIHQIVTWQRGEEAICYMPQYLVTHGVQLTVNSTECETLMVAPCIHPW